jgi:hypothetical protein
MAEQPSGWASFMQVPTRDLQIVVAEGTPPRALSVSHQPPKERSPRPRAKLLFPNCHMPGFSARTRLNLIASLSAEHLLTTVGAITSYELPDFESPHKGNFPKPNNHCATKSITA